MPADDVAVVIFANHQDEYGIFLNPVEGQDDGDR